MTTECVKSSNWIIVFGLFSVCNLIISKFKISNSLEEVLEALTSAGEERRIDRFSSIVKGLRHNSVQLQVGVTHITHIVLSRVFWLVYIWHGSMKSWVPFTILHRFEEVYRILCILYHNLSYRCNLVYTHNYFYRLLP